MQSDDDKTQSHVTLTNGTMVSHYRIIEKIGAGGMGEVYLAEDSKLNRRAALKFLPSHLCPDAEYRARFTREAQAAAKLNHPNIVTIYEVSEFNGRPYFAMEYLEGQSLRELIKEKEVSLSETISLAVQLFNGLQAAHAKGVIHRDIKPANILVDGSGRAKILDFGLAAIKGEKKLTKTGSTLGTLQYMSPEQTRGEPLDERSDIFSCGVVLYEMITGQTPFRGEHEPAIMYSIAYEAPEPLARYKAGASDDLQRIIDKALSKDRGLRYQHADDLSADLKRLISSISTPPSPVKRKRRILIPSIILLIAAAALVIFKPWQLVIKPINEAPADIRRVVVVPFKNETGDQSLDPIGKMVADWTIQGIMQIGKIEIVRPEVSLGLDTSKGIRSIAKDAGANRVVTGVYYKIGDSIQFQAQVNDSAEKLLAPVLPISVATSNVMDGVEEVRQRVMGALAIGGTVYRAPKYEAYLQYLKGVDLFWKKSDNAGSIPYFRRACAIDSGFNTPLLQVFYAYTNLGQNTEADSILTILEGRRSQLSPFQQLMLDGQRAQLAGDWMGQLAVLREETKQYPANADIYLYGSVATWVNRPNEAVEAFKKVNIERTWVWYWTNFAAAYHMLGDHKKELETIREGRRRFPTVVEVYNAELMALAAMGKIDEVRKLLENRPALPNDISLTSPATPAGSMRNAAIELRAHGHEDEAMKLLDEAIRWYEAQPPEKFSDAIKGSYGLTLYHARRWDKAKVVYEALAKKFPRDSADGRLYEIYLGYIAARQGGRTKAKEVSEWLKNSKLTYQYGNDSYQRACIAAILGDKEQAVALLKECFLQGKQFGVGIHSDFDLESLWHYQPFIELLKPKG